MNKQRFFKPFLYATVAAGAAAALFSFQRLSIAQLDLRFLILAVITVAIGSHLGVKIPQVKGEITVADTLIFLAMLLYGGEAAILLAAVEGLVSSLRVSRKSRVFLFNSAQMTCSTFLTVWALRLCFGPIENLRNGWELRISAGVLCLMALVQYVANSGLAAFYTALKTDRPIWSTWRNSYLWTSVTYLAGASVAGVTVKFGGQVSLNTALMIAPAIAVVYFTYRLYLKNFEASIAQAEQAQQHAEVLQESEERFRSAFDHAAIGMALVSPEGHWLQVNNSFCEIVGYSEQELSAMDIQTIAHPEDLETILMQLRQIGEGKLPSCQMEKRYLHKHGHEVWVLLSVSQHRDMQSLRFIFQIQDITNRKHAEARLVHNAFHDGLTGLPNRDLFIDHLKLAIARRRRNEDYRFSVLFLDLDRFKIVNDSLGHYMGDQLLVHFAHRLEACLRPGDTVARLGGDEFTILLEDLKDPSEPKKVAERIQQALGIPFDLNGNMVFTTASIGIVRGVGYEKPESILRDADTAMYQAKLQGRMQTELFDEGMHNRAVRLLELETDLRRAVERQEFVVHYQPIVSLDTFKVCDFEALVRWEHPERGLISPDEFIPLAEDTGLIIPIGQWVLREACRQMREWQDCYPCDPPLSVSVNLSGKQFLQPDLTEQMKQILDETGLDARCLRLEITESVVMKNPEAAADLLKQLRALGIGISMDDFGTGYSSLSYLHRFPISTLKIDRSFVSRMQDSTENLEIVRTIILLAQSLGIDVTAEGIETVEQLGQLRALGCESGQGYYFSRPMNVEATEELLSNTFGNTGVLQPSYRFGSFEATLVA